MVSILCLKIFVQQFVLSSPIKYKIVTLTSINYFGTSITLTNRNFTYRHLKRGNQRLEATSLTNRSRSYKSLIDSWFYVPLKNISLSSRSRIFHFHDWLIIYGFTSHCETTSLLSQIVIVRKRQEATSLGQRLWQIVIDFTNRNCTYRGNVSDKS
jgi:hypothetical protein